MVIELKNVGKTYSAGKDEEVKALSGVDLKIEQGEFICIFGVSGSGKSTLLHLIGAMDTPTEGSVEYDGKNIAKLSDKEQARFRNENIGFLFQDYALIPYRSVEDNLKIPLYFSKFKASEFKEIINKKLEEVGMSQYLRRKVSSLSGGQKQKVALARALTCNPSVILCDEPTGALDSKSSEEILNLLLNIKKNGTTVIVVTHNMMFEDYSDRNIYIKDGQLSKKKSTRP